MEDAIVLERAALAHHIAEAEEARQRGDVPTWRHHRAQALLADKRLRSWEARAAA